MRTLFFTLMILTSCILNAQQPGIYYFTNQGVPCFAKDANVKLSLIQKDKNIYKELTYQGKDDSWEIPDFYTLYQFENDSVCSVKVLRNKILADERKRIYRKLNDSLFSFTDYSNGILVRKGTSTSVLPLLFEGIVIEYYADGKIKSETTYYQHKMVGNRKWNSQGIIESENFFEISQVDSKPQFKEGELLTFISKSLDYPIIAAKNKIQGRVYVQFAITEDGFVDQLKVLKSADPLLDKEAIRVIRLTDGKWIPAMINNNPVKVLFTMPISFILQ
jgi:TonB family protein